jgi:DNA adenine methylase
MLSFLMQYLPSRESAKGKYLEPFVGGGAVFFALNPKTALLSDINPELIDLYRGLRNFPDKVWTIFQAYPTTKRAYYEIRDSKFERLDLPSRAARTLYLNRTCFKGMWRHNSNGRFNVGYGGQDRRWVINREALIEVSRRLKRASLRSCDFEEVIESSSGGDFIFVDPPYRPGEREMINDHYVNSRFSYNEHKRLSSALRSATRRGVQWAMTTSSHLDILRLFRHNKIIPLPKGTGNRPGILRDNSREVLICNYKEVQK